MTVASPPREREARARRLTLPFASEYPFEPHFHDVDGGALHYVDEGPRDGEVVLCVHGNPTWSFYYRHLIRALSPERRVFAPDHIGCGLSDKPQDWSYRLADHIANLERLVLDLDLSRIHLVVHDWGGAIGTGVAVRHPERFLSISASNTAAFPSTRIPTRIDVCRLPVFGPLAIRGLNAFARAATVMAVEKRERMTPAVRAGYLAPYGNWQDRIATLRFVQDIPLSPKHPSFDALAAIDAGLPRLAQLPVNLFWGERDWCFTPEFRREWQARFPAAEVLAIEDAGHYVLEDAHEQVIPWLTKQLQRTTRA
ncbi:MAG: alpha/beta fold hydrolase [Planctomycetes bacterium]|nr:alpha/beta fold hydrolase [Planctomycetota bacterium]MCB9904870.1 alpha/beta fold hydrolase [Planctomycetota bacterium]